MPVGLEVIGKKEALQSMRIGRKADPQARIDSLLEELETLMAQEKSGGAKPPGRGPGDVRTGAASMRPDSTAAPSLPAKGPALPAPTPPPSRPSPGTMAPSAPYTPSPGASAPADALRVEGPPVGGSPMPAAAPKSRPSPGVMAPSAPMAPAPKEPPAGKVGGIPRNSPFFTGQAPPTAAPTAPDTEIDIRMKLLAHGGEKAVRAQLASPNPDMPAGEIAKAKALLNQLDDMKKMSGPPTKGGAAQLGGL